MRSYFASKFKSPFFSSYRYLIKSKDSITRFQSTAHESNGKNTVGLVVFGILCAGTFGLGCWQTSRFFWKQELYVSKKKSLEQDPVNISELDFSSKDESLSLKRVMASGHFEPSNQVLIFPRPPPKGVTDAPVKNNGVIIVSPLRLRDGRQGQGR
jgi:cytochrome oxidase assembly protein ShyY1